MQPFDLLAAAGTSSVLPPGWHLTEIGSSSAADGSYVAGTGTGNAGGAYSFGTAAADRALGSLGSGTATPIHYVVGFNPLAGDFSDDGVLDDDDRTALLAAAHDTPNAAADRRMDMNGDGAITQTDFDVWQSQFIEWKKKYR